MAQQPVLARDTITQIRAVDGVTWLEVEGIDSFVPDPAANEVEQETSRYSNGGQYSAIKTQRGGTITIGYFKLKDNVTYVRPPGQLRVETVAAAIGADNLAPVRYRETTDTEWTYWSEAMVKMGSTTGGTNELRKGTYTFIRNVLPQQVAV